MRPGVLLFDAVGTLILPDPPAAQTYRQAAEAMGLRRTEADIARRLAAAIRDDERQAARHATSPQAEWLFWRGVVRHALELEQGEPLLDSTLDPLFDTLWRAFADPARWRVLPGVAETLRELQAAGWTLGVASNFDSRLRDVCHGLTDLPSGLRQQIFACDEIGWRKPHPRFYEVVSARLPAGRRILIGDDFASDVRGPCAAGWHAVLLGEPPEPLPPTARAVEKFTALPELLRHWP